MGSVLIDLDAAPAEPQRPGRSRPRARGALAALGLLLVALLGPAAPPIPRARPATLIAARHEDGVFVHGDRLYVVGAAPRGGSRPMRTYRLPDGALLARTDLPIPEPVTAVLPAGDVTLVVTTVGERPAVMAVDDATARSRWWQFGRIRGVSAASGLVLITDAQRGDNVLAVDLRTGGFRWQVFAPAGGQLLDAGSRAGDEMPRWLVATDPHGRLDSYDGRTGRHLATALDVPSGPLAGATGDLFLAGGTRDGILAYNLPGLTVRWPLRTEGRPLEAPSLGPDCGDLICLLGPGLTALDPATGQLRWASDRWNYAQRAGDFLIVSETGSAPDLAPITVADPATGRVRARLGGWRRISGQDTLTYLVHAGHPTYFGRFDPDRLAVRLTGATDADLDRCEAAAGAVACHLTDGPVAIWRF